jgi:SAM-dependent methyltransferase
VRDWCDSVERLPLLATASRDLKDVQRPWALKTITAALPPTSRLLEIGAGEPLVAGMLARDGYDVTVVDPYDGRDGGPSNVGDTPGVRVVRGLFPRDVPAAERFDCVYSISVLEHLPAGAIDEVCAGIRALTRPGGLTIHAIDHVLLGTGAEDHLAHLRRLTGAFGLDEQALDGLLATLAADPDAYFLSAEGHNRWRGSVPYDEFPMRRCVSIQLCLPLP